MKSEELKVKIKFQIFLCLLCLFLLGACNPAAKFSVIEAGEPVFNGLKSVHGRAVVESGAGKELVVENAVLDFRYKSRELATARLMLPIEIPAGEVSRVRYDLKLESESLSNLQTLQNRIHTNPSQVSVDVTAWVRYGKMRRKIEIKDVPYTGIIANFGTLENR